MDEDESIQQYKPYPQSAIFVNFKDSVIFVRRQTIYVVKKSSGNLAFLTATEREMNIAQSKVMLVLL